MVDLVPIILKPDNFEAIYEEIKSVLKKDTNKRQLHKDLYQIIIGTGQNEWIYDYEYGPTIGERTKLVKGFAHEIESLIKRYETIEKYYPKSQCPETGIAHGSLPKWLSQFTEKFDLEELKTMSSQLRAFEDQGNQLMANGAKPRLSGRQYYIEELIKVFEKHTTINATVNKTDRTHFSDFVIAFFEHANAQLQYTNIKRGVVYDEYHKIKKSCNS